MKKILFTAVMLAGLSDLSYAQVKGVGINTQNPAATLDVVADNATATMPDGILVPRMTAAELNAKNGAYTAAQNAALVFVLSGTGIAGTKTENISGPGFYYYNSATSKWIPVGGGGSATDTSIYLGDGTLTSARTVNQNNQNLTFTTGTAKTIVNGNFQMQGAVYATSVRIYSGATNVNWNANDYFVILTNSAINGQFALPSPTGTNTGRVLLVRNNTGGAVSPTNADGIAYPLNFPNLAGGSAAMFISDGTNWWNAASR
jgi:hypothetical protein